jgi:hypothetical protein
MLSGLKAVYRNCWRQHGKKRQQKDKWQVYYSCIRADAKLFNISANTCSTDCAGRRVNSAISEILNGMHPTNQTHDCYLKKILYGRWGTIVDIPVKRFVSKV